MKTSSMRIAIVDNEFPRASKEFISKQASELIHRGYDVQVYSHKEPTCNNYTNISKDLYDRTTYFPIPHNKLKRIFYGIGKFPQLAQANKRIAISIINPLQLGKDALTLRPLYYASELFDQYYDVIHVHWGQYGRYVAMLKSVGLDAKLVTTFHGSDVRDAMDNPKKYDVLFKNGDYFIANSKYTYSQLIELGVDGKRIVHIPNPFDPTKIPFKQDYKNTHTDQKPIQIITVANLTPIKGIDNAIKSISGLINKFGFNVHYHIVGSGSERAALEKLICQLGISNSVTLHGHLHRDSVFKKLYYSDVFLLPSIEEGFGMVLLEAQAVGLPIVATNTGGIPEALNTRSGNKLVCPGDATAIESALRELLDDQESWSEIGKRNRHYIEDKYSVEGHIDELISIYNS